MIGVSFYLVPRVRVARLRRGNFSLFTFKCMVSPYKSAMSMCDSPAVLWL